MAGKKAKSEVEKTSEKASELISLAEVTEWCQTGCTVLDLAIANLFPGGIPIGRIITFFGGNSTCKSVLAALILGYAIRSGRIAHYADVEHTLDERFAKLFGYEPNKSILSYPNTLEEMFDDWIAGAIYKDQKKGTYDTKPKVMVADTVAALPAQVELEKKMSDSQARAPRAKQLSLGFRKYIKALSESNTTLVFMDQTRTDMNSPWGGETVSGGKSPLFYPSVRVHLKSDGKVVNKADKVIGIWTKFIVKKNKVGPPFREGRFKVLFDHALDDIGSNIYFLSEAQNGPKEAKKKTTKIEIFGEEHAFGYWVQKVEDENLEEDLRQAVWEKWQEVYQTEKRKKRTYV